MLTNYNVNKTDQISSTVNIRSVRSQRWQKKRIRIDMEDADGARYDIKLEGNVTRDKVLKIFEMMDLMNIEEEEEQSIKMDSVGYKNLAYCR